MTAKVTIKGSPWFEIRELCRTLAGVNESPRNEQAMASVDALVDCISTELSLDKGMVRTVVAQWIEQIRESARHYTAEAEEHEYEMNRLRDAAVMWRSTLPGGVDG